jgi:inosine-uridine nucleoside N-ribohydrolase
MDPLAASIVFGSKASIRLIPLDATQQVPIRADFVKSLGNGAKGTLEQFAAQVLASDDVEIREGYFYAWDPLAAVALVDLNVVQVTPMAIQIALTGNEMGRSVETQGAPPNARVGLSADAAEFRREFVAALAAAPAPKPQAPAAAPAAKPTPATTAPQTKSAAPAATAAPAAPSNGKP